MAYFHCLIGGGSSGGGYELTVTCDADFAGTTITCTDGVTTLTQTCPSASPYEVVFEIPNGGDWTISGVVGGHTVSTGVNIPTSAELIATIQQTVTIYSAKEDTVTYTDIYGDTQTEVFASGESSKQITIDIDVSGSSITFTSGVAKDPTNLSNAYSKTVTISGNTTSIYLMPDNAGYWYGYIDNNLVEELSTTNGWSFYTIGFTAPIYNTNNLTLNNGHGQTSSGLAYKTKKNNIIAKSIYQSTTMSSGNGGTITLHSSKSMADEATLAVISAQNTNLQTLSLSITSEGYITADATYLREGTLYAFWYE